MFFSNNTFATAIAADKLHFSGEPFFLAAYSIIQLAAIPMNQQAATVKYFLFFGCTPTFSYLLSTAVISSPSHLGYRKTFGSHRSFNHPHTPTINRCNIQFLICRETFLWTCRCAPSLHPCSNTCCDCCSGLPVVVRPSHCSRGFR